MTTPGQPPDSTPSPPSPPPGSQGYRRQGDPLPRGNPMAGPIKRFHAPAGSEPTPADMPPLTPAPAASAGDSREAGALFTPSAKPSPEPPPELSSESPQAAAPASDAGLPIEPLVVASAAPLGRPPADRRRFLLALAALISLGVHGALAIEYYDRPLGHVDPALMAQERDLFRVQRAPQDFTFDAAPGQAGHATHPDAPASAGAYDPANAPAPLADLSRALLDVPLVQDDEAASPATAQALPAPSARPFEDRRPAAASQADTSAASQDPAGPQPVSLPPSVQSHLLVDLPLAVSYVEQSTQGKSGSQATPGSGDGAGQPGSSGGPGQAGGASADPRALLAQANLPSAAPASPPLPALPAPRLSDRPDVQEQRPAVSSGLPTAIDLSAMTAEAATHLSIPEYLDNDFDYTVTTHLPKAGWGVSKDDLRGYFRVDITGKRSLRKLQTMPKDLVFLVDVSGSISQEWIDHTLRGLRDALASLNPGDRFNIVVFNEQPAILGTQGILPVNAENLAKAQAFLTSQQSGGMTDVNQALSRLLVRDVASDRVYGLVLISDGRPTRGVVDTRELINLVTRDNDLAASIYCVGIGRGQNRTLLEFLAYRNKGFCVYVNEPFDAAGTIRDLISRLRYPIMKDIRLSVMGLDVQDIHPRHLPNIHQGETFSIFGRFDPDADGGAQPFTMRLMGHNGKQLYDFTFTRDLAQAAAGPQQISRDWGFWKLHHIYSLMIHQGQTSALKREIQTLRRKYKLDTLYHD